MGIEFQHVCLENPHANFIVSAAIQCWQEKLETWHWPTMHWSFTYQHRIYTDDPQDLNFDCHQSHKWPTQHPNNDKQSAATVFQLNTVRTAISAIIWVFFWHSFRQCCFLEIKACSIAKTPYQSVSCIHQCSLLMSVATCPTCPGRWRKDEVLKAVLTSSLGLFRALDILGPNSRWTKKEDRFGVRDDVLQHMVQTGESHELGYLMNSMGNLLEIFLQSSQLRFAFAFASRPPEDRPKCANFGLTGEAL